ncbi:MAG: hypothetical protein AAF846_19235 [Chloroflexota bacterium]
MHNPHLIQMIQEAKQQDMMRDANRYRIATRGTSKTVNRKDRKMMTLSSIFGIVNRHLHSFLHYVRMTSQPKEFNRTRELRDAMRSE